MSKQESPSQGFDEVWAEKENQEQIEMLTVNFHNDPLFIAKSAFKAGWQKCLDRGAKAESLPAAAPTREWMLRQAIDNLESALSAIGPRLDCKCQKFAHAEGCDMNWAWGEFECIRRLTLTAKQESLSVGFDADELRGHITELLEWLRSGLEHFTKDDDQAQVEHLTKRIDQELELIQTKVFKLTADCVSAKLAESERNNEVSLVADFLHRGGTPGSDSHIHNSGLAGLGETVAELERELDSVTECLIAEQNMREELEGKLKATDAHWQRIHSEMVDAGIEREKRIAELEHAAESTRGTYEASVKLVKENAILKAQLKYERDAKDAYLARAQELEADRAKLIEATKALMHQWGVHLANQHARPAGSLKKALDDASELLKEVGEEI